MMSVSLQLRFHEDLISWGFNDAEKGEEPSQNSTGRPGPWPGETWDYCFKGYGGTQRLSHGLKLFVPEGSSAYACSGHLKFTKDNLDDPEDSWEKVRGDKHKTVWS